FHRAYAQLYETQKLRLNDCHGHHHTKLDLDPGVLRVFIDFSSQPKAHEGMSKSRAEPLFGEHLDMAILESVRDARLGLAVWGNEASGSRMLCANTAARRLLGYESEDELPFDAFG